MLVPLMQRHGIDRLVAISAGGVGESSHQLRWPVTRLVRLGNIGVAYRGLADMETVLEGSGLDWLAVRPVTLVNGAPRGRARWPLPSRYAAHRLMSTTRTIAQSAGERRLAEAELRRLVGAFAKAHRSLVAATRRALRKRLPTAHEVVYEYRDCFVISFSPSEHGYEGVLALRASAGGVRLYLNRAKGVPDPEKLLQGSGGQARWIPLEGARTLARPAVVNLVEAAIARNRVKFARTGRGSVVIRPGAATKRRSARTRAPSCAPSRPRLP